MKYCMYCGAEMSDDTAYCVKCGRKVETASPSETHENNDDTINTIIKVFLIVGCVLQGWLILPLAWCIPITVSIFNSLRNKTPINTEMKVCALLFVNFVAGICLLCINNDRGTGFWNKLYSYKKVTTVALTLFTLMCLIAFIAGKVFAGIIALLSIALTVVALLIKKQIIKAPESWIQMIAIVLIVPYFLLFGVSENSSTDDGEKFSWSNLILGEVIPQPKSDVEEIITNTESSLSVYINRTSTNDFYDYIKACKDKGFTVDAEQLTSSFNAYNESGYKLSLYYTESDNEMHIGVDAPDEYGELKWPDDGLGKLLPIPVSNVGEIKKDDDKGFEAVVAETSFEDFKTYAKLCSDTGFSIEAKESDQSFYAKNKDGYILSLKYTGNNVMTVSIDEPEYQVTIEVECIGNLIFSKYDVDVYMEDSFEDTLPHGTTDTYSFSLPKGTYTVKFVNSEDDDVTGTVKIDVTKDADFKFKLYCYGAKISVKSNDDKPNSNEDNDDTTVTESVESKPPEQTESPKTPTPVFYSTNDYETAKKGNSGVFSYRNRGSSYDSYWIIDFNEGYVYYFTEGNGNTTCDKVKIVSGDLNDKIIVTYHDGGDVWSYGLHFKYVNHPETLIMQDNDGFEYKYSATDLDNALRLRNTKTIHEY